MEHSLWVLCTATRRARERVALLRRSSDGWMPAKAYKSSVGVGRKHTVTRRKVWLIGLSMRRALALRHQTGAKYSAVE